MIVLGIGGEGEGGAIAWGGGGGGGGGGPRPPSGRLWLPYNIFSGEDRLNVYQFYEQQAFLEMISCFAVTGPD